MSKQSKEGALSNEVNKEIKLIINEIFGLGKTSSEKEAEDAENAKEGETWLPIWKELPEPYHSFFTLYVKFMESNDMKLDTERKTKIAELFRDRSDSAVRVVGGEMCSVGDPWMAALKDIADKYSYNLPPNCLTGDSSGDGGGDDDGEDPGPGETETTTTGGDGPVPIFKDMRVKDPETGKMARVGAKEGGQGLQALLANWLAKNAPGEVDKKALQQAAGRLVKAVAAQLKANDIAIQENQVVNYVKSMLAEMSARPGSLITRRGEQGGSIDRGELKKMIQRIAKGKIGKRGTFKNLNVDAVLQVAMDFLRAEKFNVVTEAVNMLELADELMRNARLDDKTALRLAQALTDEFGDKELFGLKVADEKPEQPEPEQPEPEEPREPTELSGDVVLDSLQARLKELDLDTTEGRYGASEPGNDQAYLGAYMFYKAMKNVLKKLKENPNAPTQALIQAAGKELSGNEYGTGSPYSPKRTGAVNEEEGEVGELEKWLGDIIQTFEREGLADAKRAVKASREARGADKCPNGQGKDPETGECVNNFSDDDTQEPMTVFGAEKCREMPDCMEKWKDKVASLLNDPDARTTAAAGTINTKQIVAPQLKSAGIDLNSPEGQKFTKSLEKVVRRFLKRHLQRLGKEDIKLIAENEEHMNKLADIVRLYTEKLLNERRKQND